MKTKNDPREESISTRKLRWTTFGSFAVLILFLGGAVGSWYALRNQSPLERSNGLQTPIRKVLDGNEQIFSEAISPNHLAKTYPLSMAAKTVRVNGAVGLGDNFDAKAWKLHLIRAAGDTLLITLDDLKKLPKTEMIFNFKCIEGWSQISHWGGVTFSDFVKAYHLNAETKMKFVGMETPDKAYYVGLDMPSAVHPQTLLCYEMNGAPLPNNQGYPLRLIIPVKYGIKSLKRIGTIFFGNDRPNDYWYERGYDYFSGL